MEQVLNLVPSLMPERFTLLLYENLFVLKIRQPKKTQQWSVQPAFDSVFLDLWISAVWFSLFWFVWVRGFTLPTLRVGNTILPRLSEETDWGAQLCGWRSTEQRGFSILNLCCDWARQLKHMLFVIQHFILTTMDVTIKEGSVRIDSHWWFV